MAEGRARSSRRSRWGLGALFACLSLSGGVAAQDAGPPRLLWSSLTLHGDSFSAADQMGTVHKLGLDPTLQAAARQLLTRARPQAGAVALVDVATGQVLAAVEFGESDGGSLLFEPVAPAASVFKLVTTLALYEKTQVSPGQSVCTKGGIRSITDEHLTPGRGVGVVCSPFSQALGTSRNAAYAQLASRYLAPQELRDVAERLGFNRALAGDTAGQLGVLAVPDEALPYARTAAGFENSRLSVLGGAQLALSIASGGWARQLRFLAPRPDSLPAVEAAPERLFSALTARRVAHSMEFTVHSGTAHDSFIDERGQRYLGSIQVAGKTGTRRPSPASPTASWFVGFAPADKPRIVISVLLQNSELWHQKGHQLARDLLRVYFARLGARGVTSPL